MSIFDDAKIDCHTHLFDPVHYPYGEDSFYKPAGQELGTPAQFRLDFGRCGNAYVKQSGYVKFSQQPYPFKDTWPYVQALVDAFGSGGCIWGSDWPFLRAPSRVDYGPQLKPMERLPPNPAAARRAVMWDNPCSLFGFQQASPLT